MYAGDDYSDLVEEFQQSVPCRGPGIPGILEMLTPEADGTCSVEEVVERALIYRWPKPQLTRQELVELVEKIASAEGSEAEMMEWLETLEANVPHPAVIDLIYYSDPPLTPEEVVDEALAHVPNIVPMPPPGESHLLWAVRIGDVAVARTLLATGADPNETSSDGKSCLELARQEENDEMVALLLRAGASE